MRPYPSVRGSRLQNGAQKVAKLHGALIGCGNVARSHLAALAGLRDVQIDAVCDLSAARAEATAGRFGVPKWYCSHEQLLAQIQPDLVHVTTPPSSHFLIAKNCLTAGTNVLCEKPITLTYEEFCTLKRLAIANSRLLMENQNFRYDTSVQRIQKLIDSGDLGELLHVDISVSLDVVSSGNPCIDPNASHYSSALRGGIIGDFLPHIAYLTYMFTGRIIDLRTIWKKHTVGSPLPADEFRAFIKGEFATALASFSGNAHPPGFFVRVIGTKMHVETNLFAPPRFAVRRMRAGEPALASVIDGITESRDILHGTIAGFWKKLGGTSIDDGLRNLVAQTYRALEKNEPQPVPLEEIDEIARIVDSFTRSDLEL
jgi:predicted dehydrogenase